MKQPADLSQETKESLLAKNKRLRDRVRTSRLALAEIAAELDRRKAASKDNDPLKLGTLKCPDDGALLHFEVMGSMRVKRRTDDGMVFRALCPTCNRHFNVRAKED